MVRNIVVLGGLSHPGLTETICEILGVQQGQALFSKFAVGETRVEIGESVRGKDVYIIQSGGGKVNDHLVELLIAISACKTASAKKVTAVLPLFPYSRQSDIPYNKTGAPLIKSSNTSSKSEPNGYSFDSIPSTPHPEKTESPGLANGHPLHKAASRSDLEGGENNPTHQARFSHYRDSSSHSSTKSEYFSGGRKRGDSSASTNGVASICEIIDEDSNFPSNISNKHHGCIMAICDFGRSAFLVDQGKLNTEGVRNCGSSFGSTRIWANNNTIAVIRNMLLNIFLEEGSAIKVVDGNVEEALILRVMKIHCDDMVSTSTGQ